MAFDYQGFGSTLNDFGSAATLFGQAAGSKAAVPGYQAEEGAYNAAAATALSNAQLTGVATNITKAQAQRQIYQVIGGSKADVAGAGLKEQGSALDVIRSSQDQGELQTRLIDTEGTIQQTAFGQQAAAYSAEANSAAANASAANSSSTASTAGGILKVVAGIASIFSIFCWVAREVYGEQDNRWMEMREFLLVYGPWWFLRYYWMYGERYALRLRVRPFERRLVRVLFDLCRYYMKTVKLMGALRAKYSRV